MLGEDLAARGYQVTVLAAVPHFPTGEVPHSYRRGIWQWDTQAGVRVCRVRVPSGNRANLVHRLVTFGIFQALASMVGLRQPCDVALITNPALETWLPFALLAVLRRKASIFCVWDVYPDVGVRLGVFRHRLVIAAVKALEDFCLKRATFVQVLAPEFAATLEARGVPGHKLALVRPWLDTDFLRPLPRHNDFAGEFQLTDRFVVLYAGNLGYSQGLEYVLEAARLLAAENVYFVLVGDGVSRGKLQAQAHQLGLTNVSFIPFQPRERLPQVLASADIALISLKRGIGKDSLPSKTFPVLASGRPVIVAADRDCDLWQLVQQSGAGLCVEPENPEQLACAVASLKADQALREQMGQRGRAYVVQNHSRQAAATAFERLLAQMTSERD
jgi:colanic acid biosynthesis glycosyl transferase WcaI